MSGERRGTNLASDGKGLRYLVTGATGFVGRRLVARLRATGAFVRGIARSTSSSCEADEIVTIDLADLPLETTALDGVDVVFHLAAKTHDIADSKGAEMQYRRINVEGTTRLIAAAAARRSIARVVFVSSVKVIDEGNTTAASEMTPPRPLTDYGRSKLEAEQRVFEAARDAAFDAVCLRFPLVYGPGQRGNLERMIAAIAAGRFPPPPSDGNRRSMLHVENAVAALLLAAQHPAASGRTYIATDARPYSTREVYDAVRHAMGRPRTRWHVPAWAFRLLALGGDVGRTLAGRRVGFDSDAFQKLLGSAVYDSSRIRQELGFEPTHDLLSSMSSMIQVRR